jgi:Flp pilus assembly protein TadG
VPRTLTSRQRGDAIVELALVAPILLVLLGRVIDVWVVVHYAAREGARLGARATTNATAGTAAQQATTNYLGSALAGRTDLARTLVPAPVVLTDSVQVTAEADVVTYVPLIQSPVGSLVVVRATAVMRRE